MGMNMRGAQKRESAMRDAAERERQLAEMEAAANERFAQQDIAQYSALANQRRSALSGMLGQYMGPTQTASAPAVQVQGDPRFDLSAVQGEGGAGSQWASAARAQAQRGLGLQQAVRGFSDQRDAERLQRAQAMGGFEQSGQRLTRQGADYADLAALRRQAFMNDMIRQRGALAMQQANASQAGSEQMLYGGLLGLGGQAAMSFMPVGPSRVRQFVPSDPQYSDPY
jgi:hypothetical protein